MDDRNVVHYFCAVKKQIPQLLTGASRFSILEDKIFTTEFFKNLLVRLLQSWRNPKF